MPFATPINAAPTADQLLTEVLALSSGYFNGPDQLLRLDGAGLAPSATMPADVAWAATAVSTGIFSDDNNVMAIAAYSRLLYDTSQFASLDWDNRRLLDNAGAASVYWQERKQFDSSGVESVDWQNRQLWDAANSLALDWSLGPQADPGNPSIGDGATSAIVNFILDVLRRYKMIQ